jgi:hypothetical protein
MRYRYEIHSLNALGEGDIRIPLNCWRVQLWINGNTAQVLYDGVSFVADLTNTADQFMGYVKLGGIPWWQFGTTPVNLDQTLQLSVPVGRVARGVIWMEYLEP